jgi:adenylate cyclase class 2
VPFSTTRDTDFMPRNIELKCRLPDLEGARAIAKSLATRELGTIRQTDTYFQAKQGRLKLREVEGQAAELIAYARPNTDDARASDYYIIRIDDPAGLLAALQATLGIRVVVRKTREVFLWHNVRIHLDEVEGLGVFLEFEAVLKEGINDARGHDQIAELARRFALRDEWRVGGSYSDLLECQMAGAKG